SVRCAALVAWLMAAGVFLTFVPFNWPAPSAETRTERLLLAHQFLSSRPEHDDVRRRMRQEMILGAKGTLAKFRSEYPEAPDAQINKVRALIDAAAQRSLERVNEAQIAAIADSFTMSELRWMMEGDHLSPAAISFFFKQSEFLERSQTYLDRATNVTLRDLRDSTLHAASELLSDSHRPNTVTAP
ncbi:MAG: hypothetical protein AAF409_07415, partial [Pseudomonadota bacterium]